ncbi:acetylornithine deacetylase [Wenyingzhuangia fucanilytica]|uniref:Acetylornithine deacetylase n=1 Tax=Wenyingzhuangia fucanilytica TaxID=1790137 RepID=A0A1B1Y9D4_9FLAO|nr:M20 family metallo-hydrolase [Wenyingzhuangia fucanilytica]ANW97387.1 acetylornithine deacetylase [Wenyingzhuangia fucanilytica]
MIETLQKEALELLQNLIQTQSFSKEEEPTAEILSAWLKERGVEVKRDLNNIWATNKYFDESKPTILLNSHHDTVKPNQAYTRDPFEAKIEGDKLYGLGSNDAGGCLVGLMSAFVYFYNQENLKYNFVLAATAEEEISGENGIAYMQNIMPKIDVAIVGEPTLLDLAIAEKGLVVFDGKVTGTPGHAAHIPNHQNPIFKALKDLEWINSYKFPKVSPFLGEVKMTVSQINAGNQHNVVPSELTFVVDCRVTDQYSNAEIAEIIAENTECDVIPRSLRLNSSSIDPNHDIVKSGIALGKKTYGSPTLSDQCRLTCQSVKIGPGDSLRSHSADEFIYVQEVYDGVDFYINLLNKIV